MKLLSVVTIFSALSFANTGSLGPTNKLLMMHQLYYLPFSLQFMEGKTPNEIIPIVAGTGVVPTPQQFDQITQAWAAAREEIFKNSLLLNTTVAINASERISGHLASHHIALNRGPFDTLPIPERLQIKNILAGTPEGVRKTFTQIRFLKTFLNENDAGRKAFFIIGASWCQSTRTYRAIFESYLKRFPALDLTIHSIIVEDPNNKIFDSPLISTLFPNVASYSHNTIPRFLLLDNDSERPIIYEEGDALKQVIDGYYGKFRGYLDVRVPFLNQKMRYLSGGWTTK